MQVSKRYLSMLLIALLMMTSLTGCAGTGKKAKTTDETNKQTNVYYQENKISLPDFEMVYNAELDKNGQLVVYDSGQNPKYVFLNSKGKPVREIKCQMQSPGVPDGNVFALDNNNNLYQLQQIDVYDPSGTQIKEYIKRLQVYDPAGKPAGTTLELGKVSGTLNSMNLHASSMAADDKGRLYILYYRGDIEILNSKTGKVIKTITGTKYRFIDIDKQGNILAIARSEDGNCLIKLDKNGKTIWRRNLKIKTAVMGFKYNRYDGSSYITDYSGVKKYDGEGKYVGEILNFRETSIIPSESYMTSLNVDATNNIYATIMYNGGSSDKPFGIFKYTPQKGAKHRTGPVKTITVGTADSDDFLETAARKYEKDHPGMKVEIKDYSGGKTRGSDEERYQNYVKTLNTEILTGKGPDIISVQGLPYNKYIDKKVFIDLNSFIKKDKSFHRQEYYTNIIKACETKGKLYSMPVCFCLPVIMADEDLLKKSGVTIDEENWTWSDFYRVSKQLTKDPNNDGNTDIYALPKTDAQRLFKNMLASDYRRFINEDKKQASINSKQFVQLLNQYKEINDKMMNPRIDDENLLFSGSRGTIAFKPQEYYGGDLTVAKAELGQNTEALAMPQGESTGDNCFEAFRLAINSNSKAKNEAWEFLKYITAAKQQKSLQLPGLCINKEAQNLAFEEQAKNNSGSTSISIGSDKGMKIMNVEPLTPERIRQTKHLIARLNRCNNNNPQIEKMMKTEISAFLKGEKSSKEIAKILQNKINIYLNE
ncbi:MAG: extracellular solute-binding protein [Chitinophagales bacterium]